MRRYAKVSKVLRIDLGIENLYCDGLHICFTGKDPNCIHTMSLQNVNVSDFLVKTWDIQIILTDRFFGEYV